MAHDPRLPGSGNHMVDAQDRVEDDERRAEERQYKEDHWEDTWEPGEE